ncbi:hypothetical protein GCM10011611_45380 [Aliidongia dinghuensis]|uniref:Uncharacterized protein n=1 Tax=Aliidongia dinghuensis TaxID=1867774 RepID=A0A8J2YWX5_9PROT|nr:hypothetical protein GCM10011611_45380 [Aliidongia dinghuensis]
MAFVLLACAAPALAPALADELPGNSTVLQPGTTLSAPSPTAPSTTTPGKGAPLVGLQQGGALSLAPPGSAAAARNEGLAGAQGGVDLSYVPAAERDSYFNSKDFAEHNNAISRPARHPSALSQLGGVAEGMAINGALGAGSSLILGGH